TGRRAAKHLKIKGLRAPPLAEHLRHGGCSRRGTCHTLECISSVADILPSKPSCAVQDMLTRRGLLLLPRLQLRRWRYRADPIRVAQVFQRQVPGVRPNEND